MLKGQGSKLCRNCRQQIIYFDCTFIVDKALPPLLLKLWRRFDVAVGGINATVKPEHDICRPCSFATGRTKVSGQASIVCENSMTTSFHPTRTEKGRCLKNATHSRISCSLYLREKCTRMKVILCCIGHRQTRYFEKSETGKSKMKSHLEAAKPPTYLGFAST